MPGVLASVARALATAPDGADDATLLTLLGRMLVPALGDAVALYAAEESAGVRLIGAAPDDAPAARQLRAHVEQQPGALADYAAIAAPGHPAVILAERAAATGWALRGATGLVAEIVAPLGSPADRDGLLTIVSSVERQYDDDDRAAVEVVAALVTSRRAAIRQADREATLQQQIDALAQAGRELAHALNNDLTMPVGVIELLMDRTGFAPDLQEMLEAASKDLAALERHVREFHGLMRTRSGGSIIG